MNAAPNQKEDVFSCLIFNLAVFCAGGLLVPFHPRLATVLVITSAILTLLTRFIFGYDPGRGILSWGKTNPSFLKAAPWSILMIAVCSGGSEWTARALTSLQVIQLEPPMITVLANGAEDWRLAHITGDTAREPDPVLFWRPVTRPPYNAQRFKGPLARIPKPENVYRIICYGDSNTDGPDSGAWPGELQNLLVSHPPDPRMKYEVLNAGVAGYSSHQGLMRFREEAHEFRPDLVLVSFGWNDLPEAIGGIADKNYRVPRSAPLIRFLLHYKSYRLFSSWIRRAPGMAAATAPAGPSVPRVGLDDYISNMQQFLELATNIHARVLFLTRPYRQEEPVLSPASAWRTKVPAYNTALLEFAAKNGAGIVDIRRVFETQYADLFANECHFTDEGHRKAADILYASIVREINRP